MGEGWAPAIINSEDELEFIRTQQLGFSSLRDYSVGGSTYSTSYDISYEEYRTDSEGMDIVIKYIRVKLEWKI